MDGDDKKKKELAVAEETFSTSLTLSKDHIGAVMANINILTEGFKQWMEEGLDYTTDLYGRDSKPSLLDTGTFKMINFFQVRPRHRVLEHILEVEEGKERVKYVVAAELLNPKSGYVVAEGVGSCSTDEVKYQYRWLTDYKLKSMYGYTDEQIKTLPSREIKPKRGGKFTVYRIRNPDILDLDNTIIKMASKRCLGSTTPLLVKTNHHICRTNASNLYDIYNSTSEPIYLPGRNGEWRMIVGITREENREIINLRLKSGESIRATREHEFPTLEGVLKAVSQFKIEDKLVRSRIVIPPIDGGGADPKYGWAVGLFIAEGEFQDEGNSIRLTLHEKETEFIARLESIVNPLGGVLTVHPKGDSKCVSVRIFGRAFAGLMSQFVNGDSCYNKTLSKFAWEQGEEFLREVLQGYLDGDSWESHRRRTPKWPLGFTGENYELQHDIRCLCAILNKRVKIIRDRAKIKDNVYSMFRGWITDVADTYNTIDLEEIESIEAETKPAVVYDIDVDGDNIFLLASGIESHNSEMDAALQLPGVSGVFTQDMGPGSAIKKQVDAEYEVKTEVSTPRSEPFGSVEAVEQYLAEHGVDVSLLDFEDGGSAAYVTPKKYMGDLWGGVNDVVRAAGGEWIKEEDRTKKSYWNVPRVYEPGPEESVEVSKSSLPPLQAPNSMEELEYMMDQKFLGAKELFTIIPNTDEFTVEATRRLDEEIVTEMNVLAERMGGDRRLKPGSLTEYVWRIPLGKEES